MERPCWPRLLARVLVLLVAVEVVVWSQAGASWSANGSMPYERGELAVAAVNGKIHLISGSSRGVEANAFHQEYDPRAGTWRELALMPSVASHAGAAALNGKISTIPAGSRLRSPSRATESRRRGGVLPNRGFELGTGLPFQTVERTHGGRGENRREQGRHEVDPALFTPIRSPRRAAGGGRRMAAIGSNRRDASVSSRDLRGPSDS
jgi:hypothetical protein